MVANTTERLPLVRTDERCSWMTPVRALRPATLALSLLWIAERSSSRLGLTAASWKCYSLREALMERSCLYCRRADLAGGLRTQTRELSAPDSGRLRYLSHGDYAHRDCADRYRAERARHRYCGL